MNELLSTTEAAERLGVTVRAVQKMIGAGTLTAAKVGRDYVIQASDVESLERRSPGRPPKTGESTVVEKPNQTAEKSGTSNRRQRNALVANLLSDRKTAQALDKAGTKKGRKK